MDLFLDLANMTESKSRALRANDAAASGVRCADSTRAAKGIRRDRSASNARSATGRSLSLPRITATFFMVASFNVRVSVRRTAPRERLRRAYGTWGQETVPFSYRNSPLNYKGTGTDCKADRRRHCGGAGALEAMAKAAPH